MNFPNTNEYAPYFERYLEKTDKSKGSLVQQLETVHTETQTLLRSLPNDKTHYRYAPDKWTIRQLVQHLIDCERIMAYRALRFMRGDATDLPGFEEDDYAAVGTAENVDWTALLDEWLWLRKSHCSLFAHCSDADSQRMGTANANPISVRAVAAVILAHEIHHINVLKERYLSGVQ